MSATLEESEVDSTRVSPAPLGPDSLTWKYFGDWRVLLVALWGGSMQNMHPQLGAGVEEHSEFFRERFPRLFRSLYPIFGVVYDGSRAPQTAREVRGYHDTIKGTDSKGRTYHALNPETFYWAHATFFVSTMLAAERFGGGLSDADRRQLFEEHVQWYRLYGMSMRPVPATWEDFQEYWSYMCNEVLEDNKATRDVLNIADLPKPRGLPWMPAPVWKLLQWPISRSFTWITVGMYDPAIRDRFGYQWTPRDERLHRLVSQVISFAFKMIPHDRRYHPRARSGWRRERGDISMEAPLVETPQRNLPPPDERDNPKHYCPI